MMIRRLAALTLTLAVAIPAIGQDPARVPSARDLLPLIPSVSTRNPAVRSFAFDALLSSGGSEAMRTRGWYSGPGQLALVVLDEADGTPLLYAQGGNGVVYDALEIRCLPFTYGGLGYLFGFSDKEKTRLTLGLSMNGGRSAGFFELDLQSCFTPEGSTVDVVGPGAYQLTTTGPESRASIRVAPGEAPPWGRFTLSSSKNKDGQNEPLVAIAIVDVNGSLAPERLAFPALQPFAGQLQLTAFPETDQDLNRVWQAYVDGFMQKAPPELQAQAAALLAPAMKQAWLAQLLAHRSHWVRIALRDPNKRATLTAGKGDVSLFSSNKVIDWDGLASRDQSIAAGLREMLKQQTPLR